MNCKQCGLSSRNSVHENKRQWGYHEFVEPPPEPEEQKLVFEDMGDAYEHIAQLQPYLCHLFGCGGHGADSLGHAFWSATEKKWRGCTCGLAEIVRRPELLDPETPLTPEVKQKLLIMGEILSKSMASPKDTSSDL